MKKRFIDLNFTPQTKYALFIVFSFPIKVKLWLNFVFKKNILALKCMFSFKIISCRNVFSQKYLLWVTLTGNRLTRKQYNFCPNLQNYEHLTWSRYLDWILCRDLHILQGSSPFLRNKSWLTTILCVSIPYFVSSCTSLSVSYNDKNSAIHTQIKVVWSCKITMKITQY